jgi:hypothetical protein
VCVCACCYTNTQWTADLTTEAAIWRSVGAHFAELRQHHSNRKLPSGTESVYHTHVTAEQPLSITIESAFTLSTAFRYLHPSRYFGINLVATIPDYWKSTIDDITFLSYVISVSQSSHSQVAAGNLWHLFEWSSIHFVYLVIFWQND